MNLTVGLEIHVELNTKSKLFCSCATAFGAPAGSQCCPFCMGLPGALPVLNEEAVRLGIIAGIALHSEIQPYSSFDRKHYFYPDMPKGYQITQHFHPLCLGGWLTLPESKRKIEILEMHLEEDSGKLIHEKEASYINLNRCGIPLLEIVTKPMITSSSEAYDFLNLLKDTLVCAGITTGKMQEGALRVDVNISVGNERGAMNAYRTEMKNLSSFRAVRTAIDHEAARQKGLLAEGYAPVSETRRWNEKEGNSVSLRKKDISVDYRCFPDPELVTLHVQKEMIEKCSMELPLLPERILLDLMEIPDVKINQASILANHPHLLECFQAAYDQIHDAKLILNWLLGDYRSIAKKNGLSIENPPFSPVQFGNLMKKAAEPDMKYQFIRNDLMNLCK